MDTNSATAIAAENGKVYLCGLDAAVDVVGGKWKALILWALGTRPHRFGELRREVEGISEKVLIQQLKELERDGIIDREVYKQVPPKVVYSLTPLGKSLNAALEPLGDWGQAHLDHITSVRNASPPASIERRREVGQVSEYGAKRP